MRSERHSLLTSAAEYSQLCEIVPATIKKLLLFERLQLLRSAPLALAASGCYFCADVVRQDTSDISRIAGPGICCGYGNPWCRKSANDAQSHHGCCRQQH